jgi:hypothetical protein
MLIVNVVCSTMSVIAEAATRVQSVGPVPDPPRQIAEAELEQEVLASNTTAAPNCQTAVDAATTLRPNRTSVVTANSRGRAT